GRGEEGGKACSDGLLKKLEEQNRRLETDRKSHTSIARTSSFRSMSDTDSVNSLRIGFTAEEPLADVTSHRPLDQSSVEGGGGGGGGMRESDSLVRLRTESEMSGEVSSTGSKSPNQGVGEEGGGGGQPDVEDTQGVSEDAEDTLRVWSHLLKNWEENVRKSVKQVRQRAREGIPGVLRGMAWQLMCGAQDHNLRDRYPALLTEEYPFERQIKRDLARTFPEHSFLKERDGLGQESLLNILK
ncbi:Ecotropic viral integration site 5 protein, partial [Geodia barretti]